MGSQYRLDESMFERLISPDSGIAQLPHTQLNIQRRMHPAISLIAKTILYPYLTDHASTRRRAVVSGLLERTYWFDHEAPEDQYAASKKTTKSFSNAFEVSMVVGLVNYLVKNNAYGLGDIAVLVSFLPTSLFALN